MLTFILLLSYVFINALNEKTTENADEDDSIVVRNNSSRDLENLKCEITQDCGVACKGFAADDNITAHINEVTKNVLKFNVTGGYEPYIIFYTVF